MIRLAKSLPKPIRRPIKVEPVLPVKEDEQIALLRSIDEKLTPKPEEPEEKEEAEEVKITEPIEVNVLNFPVPPEPKECKHEMKECVHKEVTVNVPDEVVVKDLPLAQGASTSELQKKTIEALKKVEEIVKKLNFTDDGELKTTGKGGNDGFYGVATAANQLAEMQILNSIVDGLGAVLDVAVTNTVTVQATNLDIRDLAFATDKVDVSGSSVKIQGEDSLGNTTDIQTAPDGDLVTHLHTASLACVDGVNNTQRFPVNENDYGFYMNPNFNWVFNGTTWDRMRGDTQGQQVHAPYYIIKYDDAGSGITYIGKAAVGTSVASAGWQIKRLDESSTPDFDVLFADGVSTFTKVWDSRAGYTYS